MQASLSAVPQVMAARSLDGDVSAAKRITGWTRARRGGRIAQRGSGWSGTAAYLSYLLITLNDRREEDAKAMLQNTKVAEHFQVRWNAHKELTEKAAEDKKRLTKQVAARMKERDGLAAEIEKKKSLITQNAAEGIDSTTLVKKVEDLQRQVDALDAEVQSLDAKVHADPPKTPFDPKRAALLAEVLATNNCSDAIEVRDVGECVTHLPFSDRLIARSPNAGDRFLADGALGVAVDDIGRPIRCSLGLSEHESFPINIKPSDRHFHVDYRPEFLDWLPASEPGRAASPSPEAATAKPHLLAFIDKGAARVVLTKTDLRYTVSHYVYEYGGHKEQWERKHESFADIAAPLRADLERLVADAGGALYLDAEYADNPLMAHVRTAVVRRTTATPRFRPCQERLPSGEIVKRIKHDWDAFVQAPWSGAISGTLALTKHLLESGERPKFWNEHFEGTYGFRIRTRDHDWVLGRVYLDAAVPNPADGAHVEVFAVPGADKYDADKTRRIARHGRISILVHRSQE